MTESKKISATDFHRFCNDTDKAREFVTSRAQELRLELDSSILTQNFYQCIALALNAPEDHVLEHEASVFFNGHKAKEEMNNLVTLLSQIDDCPAKDSLIEVILKYRMLQLNTTRASPETE